MICAAQDGGDGLRGTPESVLVAAKLRRLPDDGVLREIVRCARGVEIGANQAARDRFRRRMTASLEEAARRGLTVPQGGAR